MNKYLAYRWHGKTIITKKDQCSFVPSGWKSPSHSFQFGDWEQKHPIKEPAKFIKPMIHASSVTLWANEFRLITPEIEQQLDSIDQQIDDLIQQKSALLDNEFLALPLVRSEELKISTLHQRYTTKKEAEQHKNNPQ